MNRSCFFQLLLLLTLLSSGVVLASNSSWQLQRQKDGISVWTRAVAGFPYKEVRSRVSLHDTRLASIVALIIDAGKCPQWSFRCRRAEVLAQVNEQEILVYTVTDLPWPASDRDMVLQCRWWQDPSSLEVTIEGIGSPERLPEQAGLVRVNRSRITWRLTPRGVGEIELTMTAHIDPSGLLPNSITNQMLVETPYRSMQALRELVMTKELRAAVLPAIREPE